MKNFSAYLTEQKVSSELGEILHQVVAVFPKISQLLRQGQEGYMGTQNSFGENQLKLDVYSNQLFLDALQKNSHVAMLGSEELDEAVEGPAGNDGYSLAFDPLDGSSLVDVNLAVGTIFGIYKGKGLVGRKGIEQVAALIAVYGPRLTFMISVGNGVTEFLYDEAQHEFFVQKEVIRVVESKKMFAPGNLRACSSEAWYSGLLQYWVKNEYTLRYSGGMVPDVNQILKKGGGIFTYPGYSEMPNGKLRLLYECAPMAYLMEQAGGIATTGQMRLLEVAAEKLDHRTPIFLGSSKEVDLVLKMMKNV